MKPTKYSVDFENSRAYSVSGFDMGIYINKNLVKEYERFREEVLQALAFIKDLETNEFVFEWVKKREEVYEGEYVEKAPDVIYKPKEGYYPSSSFGTDVVERNDLWGHDFDGIFIAHGQAFKGVELDKVTLYDIASTVLAIFGVPVPKYMDGKPLVAAKFELKFSEVEKLSLAIKKLKFERKI